MCEIFWYYCTTFHDISYIMLVVNQILTGFAFRFEDRKWNRGRNRLPKQVQTIVPSVPFPVFKSEGEPGTYNE